MGRVWIVELRVFESFEWIRLNARFSRLYGQHPARLSKDTIFALKSACSMLPADIDPVALVLPLPSNVSLADAVLQFELCTVVEALLVTSS